MPILLSKLELFKAQVRKYLQAELAVTKAREVPEASALGLLVGHHEVEGAILYIDLVQSSLLAADFQKRVAAKVIKSFLFCSTKAIQKFEGKVRSFDGDRVMGIFIGPDRCVKATQAAFTISYLVENVLKPELKGHFDSIRESGYVIQHTTGIDTGQFLAVRVGVKGNNDIAWIGRAPNLAAKLSGLRIPPYTTIVSSDVYYMLSRELQASQDIRSAWQSYTYDFLGENFVIMASAGQLPI